MTPADLRRGWCPSLSRPMESGDGWLTRLRPREAVFTADAARDLAAAATAWGNGRIEITNRANLQIRGLRPETIAPFTAAMAPHGGEAGEDGPMILVPPLLGADPGVAAETRAIARAIAEALGPIWAGRTRRGPLPPKFGFLVDGGGVLPLTGMALDVTLRAEAGRWCLNGAPVAAMEGAARAVALAVTMPPALRRRAAAPPLGFHRYGKADQGALLLAPPFGQMEAPQLAALAGLAERWGDGALRPTPWKSLAIAGVSMRDEGALREQAERIGLIVEAIDPRLGIVTCAGRPACPRGGVETREAALALAASRRTGDPLIHLSGCAKGCAHPGPAPLTLTGVGAGSGDCFDAVFGGRPGDPPAARGLTLAQCAALMHSLPA